MEALKALAADEIARCQRILRERGAYSVAAVEVRCDLRGRTRRGMAYWRQNLIRLNPAYFAAVGDAYRQTIAHEYAHLVQRNAEASKGVRHERPHGLFWQSLMRLFGYSTERSSAYGRCEVAPARRVRKYRYTGVNCGHVFIFGPKRHANAQRGVMYLCATATCKYRPKDERGLAFDKEVS